jgi:hypothetical protein
MPFTAYDSSDITLGESRKNIDASTLSPIAVKETVLSVIPSEMTVCPRASRKPPYAIPPAANTLASKLMFARTRTFSLVDAVLTDRSISMDINPILSARLIVSSYSATTARSGFHGAFPWQAQRKGSPDAAAADVVVSTHLPFCSLLTYTYCSVLGSPPAQSKYSEVQPSCHAKRPVSRFSPIQVLWSGRTCQMKSFSSSSMMQSMLEPIDAQVLAHDSQVGLGALSK